MAVGLAAAGVAAPAQAATCSGTSGVSVIVDFGSSLRTGCAAGDPANAWSAIEAAGFALEGTQRFPGSFICRVAGYPGPDQEACVQTPPSSAYWALWSAPAGGSWTYASSGAASLDPAPGTAIGLAFGAGRAPGMAPPATAPSAPATTTKPATAPPSSTTNPGSAGPATSTSTPASTPTTASAATTPSGAGRSSSTSGTVTTSSTSGAASSSTPLSGAGSVAPPNADAAPAATTGGSGPSAAVTIGAGAGIGILLVLGASIVRRQRDRATQA